MQEIFSQKKLIASYVKEEKMRGHLLEGETLS